MILNSPYISGSLTVTGNIITSGSITISGSIASASYASNADLLDGLDSTVFTLTSSFAAFTSSLNSFSASVNAFSASQNSFTASILAQTASLNSFSASILSYTASQNILNGTFTLTSSFNAQTASFTAFTSSINAFSASVLTFTGSTSTRLGALESYTSSLNNKTSSFATTGSNNFIGNQVVSGSFTTSGSITSTSTITAQTLVVQTITSSVVYSSGSNIFGNVIGNTQTFTGSVLMTGSLTIAGASSATSYSGATIYGSTAVCSPVGKFTTCLDLGGALTGTSATFSGTITTNGEYRVDPASGDGILRIYTAGTERAAVRANATKFYIEVGTFGERLSINNSSGLLTYTGAATFSSTITGTTIYGSTAVCSPVGKFTTCIDAGTGTFSGALSGTIATFAVSSGDNLILEKPTGAYLSFKNGATLRGSINGNNGTDGLNLNYGASHTTALAISSTGAATFTNTETTFNYNPQTNLLASYNYINFGGGSIMYRNATDIYIGSNAKYGSAGTVVAGYTSLYGMGLLTMDAGTLNYQANNTSVTAGTAYGVPIRFTIKGDGNVGIGASSPCGKLQVVLPAYTSEDTDSQQAIFGSCTNGYGVRIGYNESCNAGYINAVKPGVAWSKLSLQGSSIVFAPTSTERVRVTTDGLTFNGDTAAANALDDYEEGTFTPTIIGSSTAGTATYAAANGLYTKIGRAVTYNLYIDWSSGTGSGNLRVDGLPFTSVNINVYPASAIGETGGVTLGANGIMTARVNPNSTQIFISQYPAGGGSASSVTYDSAGYLVLAGTYYV